MSASSPFLNVPPAAAGLATTAPRAYSQPVSPGAWVSVSSPTTTNQPPAGGMYSLSGASGPVSGWGFAGLPRTGFNSTEVYDEATQGLFLAEVSIVEGHLGFNCEKVENGPADAFYFATRVEAVDRGSWAEQAGIEVGCLILRINGEDVSPMTVEDIEAQLLSLRPLRILLQRPDDLTPACEAPLDVPVKLNEEYYEEIVASTSKKLGELEFPDVSKSLLEMPTGVLNMFPMFFLFFSCAIFLMPILLLTYVGEDATTRRWFAHCTRFIVILPCLYIITYFVHLIRKTPSRFFITLSLIGSCVMLLIITDVILVDAYEKAPMFASSADCMSWGEKREVEDEWKMAASFYANCANDQAKKQKIKFAAAVNDYRIQDCPGYAETAEKHPDWAYLQNLEETQQCGGWCTAAQPLWTRGHVQDACSPVVASIIRDTIEWCLKQLMVYLVFTLCVCSLVLLAIPQVLRKYGLEW